MPAARFKSGFEDAMGKEQRTATLFTVVLAGAAASGILTHAFAPGPATWVYWNYLGHTLLGLLLLPLAVVYIARHIRRTLGIRKLATNILGYATALTLMAVAFTGTFVTIAGNAEARRWVFEVHIGTGYLLLFLIGLHAAIALWQADSGRREVPRLVTRPRNVRHLGLGLAGYAALIALTSVAYDGTRDAPDTGPAVTPYEMHYGPDPFAPSQTRTSNGGFVPAERISVSRECGTCHEQIYEEWKASAHSQAASDPSYVKNINLLEKQRGTAAARYCEGCHAPVALLSGELTAGGKHGGTPDTAAFHEGVGCLGCHGIERVVHLKGVGSYEFAPNDTYLFEHSRQPLARALHNFLIRINPAEHRRAMNREPIFTPEMCATCHESFMDKDMNDWGWVKLQTDYSTWVDSHFSGRGEHDFRRTEVSRCQDCHFPLVTGNDPSADREGRIRSHRTPGANTVLPWLNNDPAQLQAVTQFLQAQRVLIDIEEPARRDATQTLRVIDESLRPGAHTTPYYLYLGEDVQLRVAVSNAMVGHDFPGGTTDINEVWIYLRVADANNVTVFETGALRADRSVDPQAQFYRSLPVDRAGRHVWRHDLFNAVGEVYKNTIPPGKSDIVEYGFRVPYWAKGQLTVTAVLRYRKFNQRYADWVLEQAAADLPIVDMARDSLVIPLRVRPAAEPVPSVGTKPQGSNRSISLAKAE